MTPSLVLRDIHLPVAPGGWPPAPGWWMLAALVVLLVALAGGYAWRRRRRQRVLAALFDDAIACARSAPESVAAMSELLRRAARRRDPVADRLQGEAWLRFLDDGDARAQFSTGAGRLLLEGGYRREIDARDLTALQPLARSRYLQWMMVRE